MSTAALTYEQHAAGPCPWLPDQTFGEQNAAAITGVMAEVATDFPHVTEAVDFDPAQFVDLPDSQRARLWQLLMGRQHGAQEQSDGKVVVEAEREPAYRRALGRVAIGNKPLMEEAKIDPAVEYDQALLTAGTPYENHARLRSAKEGNAKEIVALTGQRMRGMWANIPGESSPRSLFVATQQESGVDPADLVHRSPFVQRELARSRTTTNNWEAPFGTEYHMFRLAVEAEYADQIDWDRYDDTVVVQPPAGRNNAIEYYDHDRKVWVTVPAREEGAVTYHLKNGKKIHVINGAATPRLYGAPRATSTSIAEEAMQYVPIPEDAKLVAISAAPHIRGAMDTIITYLDEARKAGVNVARADIAAGPWEHRITNIVAGLGELLATSKADLRLRAVLNGEDPNTKKLTSI